MYSDSLTTSPRISNSPQALPTGQGDGGCLSKAAAGGSCPVWLKVSLPKGKGGKEIQCGTKWK